MTDSSNSGNHIDTNYGYCNQVIYQADPPRPISQHWLDRTGRLLALSVTCAMLLLSGCYLVEQWHPLPQPSDSGRRNCRPCPRHAARLLDHAELIAGVWLLYHPRF